MKVNVYVTLKPGVLDPQGKAIHHALEGLGFDPAVVDKDRNQSEFTKPIWTYLDSAASDDRIAAGEKALARGPGAVNEGMG